MTILSQQIIFTGVNSTPRWIAITATDAYAAVTTTGFLTNKLGDSYLPSDCFCIYYNCTTNSSGGTLGFFTPTISNGAITLNPVTSAGEVVLPTVARTLAVFVDAAGTISSATSGSNAASLAFATMGQATAFTVPDPGVSSSSFLLTNSATTQTIVTGNLIVAAGSIQAGSSGAAGTLTTFPATAAKGNLKLVAVANTGNTVTTISNVAMGQASVISIPDPAAATANFVVAPSALVSGNVVKASGTGGLVVDAGFAVKAQTTGTYGGGSTSNAFTATGIGTTSIVTANILTSTNSVAITKAVPTTNVLTITFSADPGAGTTVNWIAITPAV